MAYDPNTDPEVIASRKRVGEAEAEARAKAERIKHDHQLAKAKGHTPEQIEARKRVAALFCEMHFADEAPAAVQARLDAIDYTQTITSINARGINVENPRGSGLLGLGAKPRYIVSQRFPPQKPEDPIYALQYFPHKP